MGLGAWKNRVLEAGQKNKRAGRKEEKRQEKK